MELCRKIAKILFLSVAVVCLTTAAANAQDLSRGNFTLGHDAQWGKHTLPKGNYNFTVRKMGTMGVTVIVTMTDASNSSHEMRLMGFRRRADASLKGSKSTVIITHGKNGDSIQGIYLAESGMEYAFPASSKKNTAMAGNSNSQREREVTLRIPVHGTQ